MSIQRIPILGLSAGLGLVLGLASQAKAGDYSYGHAEVTLGFPHGEVTVGRTWDNGPREVVVERVTHKYPDPDYDEDATVEEDHDDGDADEVIIEKRKHHCHPKKVVVIERYGEPVYCDRERVVRQVYVDPCPRRDVIVYRAPQRVIYAPSRVIVGPRCDRGYRSEVHVRGGGYGGGYGGHGSYDHGSHGFYDHGGRGPRNLFPEDGGRPTGNGGLRPPRGVQRIVSAGGH